jgi:hypothetical protein
MVVMRLSLLLALPLLGACAAPEGLSPEREAAFRQAQADALTQNVADFQEIIGVQGGVSGLGPKGRAAGRILCNNILLASFYVEPGALSAVTEPCEVLGVILQADTAL